MSIKRYVARGLLGHVDGGVVMYSDHLKEVEGRKASADREIERLTAERDKFSRAMTWWRSKYRTLFREATDTALVVTRNFVKMKHRAEAAEAERDAAVARAERAEEALRKSFEAVEAWQKYGLEVWVVKELQAACELSRAAIAAAPQPTTVQADAPTVRCRECGWTGQGGDVVQDVHLYCPKCGGVKLTETPATKGEGDE